MKKIIYKLLNKFPHNDIGWKEIGETFIRYDIIKTKWFNLYLHELDAPILDEKCHDHPWSFVTLLLKNGYMERVGSKMFHRKVGTVLYRPAKFSHAVSTPFGKSWSLVITTAKKRKWGYNSCPD